MSNNILNKLSLKKLSGEGEFEGGGEASPLNMYPIYFSNLVTNGSDSRGAFWSPHRRPGIGSLHASHYVPGEMIRGVWLARLQMKPIFVKSKILPTLLSTEKT